jgi:hypothetical protein
MSRSFWRSWRRGYLLVVRAQFEKSTRGARALHTHRIDCYSNCTGLVSWLRNWLDPTKATVDLVGVLGAVRDQAGTWDRVCGQR